MQVMILNYLGPFNRFLFLVLCSLFHVFCFLLHLFSEQDTKLYLKTILIFCFLKKNRNRNLFNIIFCFLCYFYSGLVKLDLHSLSQAPLEILIENRFLTLSMDQSRIATCSLIRFKSKPNSFHELGSNRHNMLKP